MEGLKFGNAYIRLLIFFISILHHEQDPSNLALRPGQLPLSKNLSGVQNAHSDVESIFMLSVS